MKRIFGQKKEKPPTPTIEEASARLTTRGDTCVFSDDSLHIILAFQCFKLLQRVGVLGTGLSVLCARVVLVLHRLDEKIKKLDAQLVQHREAIRKARPGPAQDAAKRRALGVGLQVDYVIRDCTSFPP